MIWGCDLMPCWAETILYVCWSPQGEERAADRDSEHAGGQPLREEGGNIGPHLRVRTTTPSAERPDLSRRKARTARPPSAERPDLRHQQKFNSHPRPSAERPDLCCPLGIDIFSKIG